MIVSAASKVLPLKISRPLISFVTILLMSSLLQSCNVLATAGEQPPPPKPLFVIKIDRSKTLEPSAAGDQRLDKFFADEIEKPGLGRDRFDQLLADAIVKSEPGQSLVGIKNHAITVKFADGNTADTFTDNAWAICKDIPGERKSSLRSFLFATKEVRSGLGKNIGTISDIVPLVRSDKLIEETRTLKMKAASPGAYSLDLAWYPIAPGIVCVYASDSPNSLAMLPAAKAAELGLTAIDMKKGPLRTLRSHLPVDVSVYSANGIFMPTCGGDFESSLILDDQIMAAIKQRVKGRLVFGVSNKEVLILTGDADKSAVEKVRQIIERGAREGSRPVSDKLYYWDDGKISLCP